MKYRSEIDGLRALAVIPVILFHAGFQWFGGGFVGVDVFFVISGYLITSLLIEDIEKNKFSIVNFYERRARRILPALFFVMLVTIPFAWIVMLPDQLRDFSQSLVAVSLFASNILFWIESGYFDAASEEKPLLHTWSLAVEEQFYLLFPIFLILFWRFGKIRLFWMIVVMAVMSLLISEWSWRNQPSANFFLAPTRAWELFVGSISAFIVKYYGLQKSNNLSLLGLAAILFSVYFYDKNTPFPSVYTLVPVIGTAFIVLYANKDTIVHKLLSAKILVGIGLISYSSYLWHQPIFALVRVWLHDHPSHNLMLILSLASLLMGALSWRFIEKPFRNRNFLSQKLYFSIVGILTFMFVSVGFYGHKNDGVFRNLTSYEKSVIDRNKGYFRKMNPLHEICFIEDENFSRQEVKPCWKKANGDKKYKLLLIGDSNMDAIAFQLSESLAEIGVSSIQLTMGGCIPFMNFQREGSTSSKCSKFVANSLNLARTEDINGIVLMGTIDKYTSGLELDKNSRYRRAYGAPVFPIGKMGIDENTRLKLVKNQIDQQLQALQDQFDIFVVQSLPVVRSSSEGNFINAFLNQNMQELSKGTLVKEYNRAIKYEIDIFGEYISLNHSSNINYIETQDLICDDNICHGYIDGVPQFKDGSHPSYESLGRKVANKISKRIEVNLMK